MGKGRVFCIIQGQESIATLFSLFHDGCIVGYSSCESKLTLRVEIEHLAQRIQPNFTTFTVEFNSAIHVTFRVWQEVGQEPIATDRLDLIFGPDLEISSTSVEDQFVEVVCLVDDSDFDYCGGVLCFDGDSAILTDESGAQHSLESIGAICNEYWHEWEVENGAAS